jgi:carotenoid cleavage dioxygenase-like enzyme
MAHSIKPTNRSSPGGETAVSELPSTDPELTARPTADAPDASPLDEVSTFDPPSKTQPAAMPLVERIFSAIGLTLPATSFETAAVPIDAPWLGGVENAQEVFGVEATPLLGALPKGIRGTLLRNGPGLFRRGEEHVPHWFDGDGGILKLELDGETGRTIVDYRFIRSKGFQEDEASAHFNRPVFGYVPEGSPLKRSVVRAKNVANTNIIAAKDRLLALYEGGPPTAIDAKTLETLGEVTLGSLNLPESFTAHPHRDASGRVFAFSFKQGPGGGGSLVELDDQGDILRKVPFHHLKSPPHDFVDAGPFLVFFDSPVKVDVFPALLGLKPIGDQITWDSKGRLNLHIVDKDSLELIVTGSNEPFSSAHFGSGRLEPDGTLSFVAFIPETNDPSGQAMAQFVRGEKVHVGGTPTRVHVDPKTGDIVKKVELAKSRAEWPVDDPNGSGLWCAVQSEGAGYFNQYAKLDRKKGIIDSIELEPGTFGNEPAVVVDSHNSKKRWLLTVQYVSRANRSELVVYDADALRSGAVYRAALPEVVPFGFHGNFVAREPT